MFRRIVHIIAVCFAGILTGGQYVVSFDYYNAAMAASFYTEKMQYAIHHIGTPLFSMLIAATILNFTAAFLYRKDRRTCYILAGAGICFLVGGLITRFGNIPLLDVMDTWSVSSPPATWSEIADRWYLFHSVRFAIDIVGLVLAVLSTFIRREDAS
ncbi:MAG: DUF1772 domain-containing protein [Acidobacteriota bacterium]